MSFISRCRIGECGCTFKGQTYQEAQAELGRHLRTVHEGGRIGKEPKSLEAFA